MKKATILFALCLLSLAFLFSCSCDDEAEKFTVSFESYIDNAGVPRQTVEMDGLAVKPDIEMKRAGYTFIGWYDGAKKWDFSKDKVTKDITLKAKWESYLSYMESPSGDGLWVAGCDFNTAEVVIPSEYNGRKITGIHWAFAERNKIKSIEIPSTITYISANAFNRCTLLEDIIIPSSVTVIERGAFSACDNLKTISCLAAEKPEGWDEQFNKTEAQVIFGYKQDK